MKYKYSLFLVFLLQSCVSTNEEPYSEPPTKTKFLACEDIKPSAERIRCGFEKNKYKVYQHYHRALVTKPELEGSMKIKVIIQQNGIVKDVSILYSDLATPELHDNVLLTVKSIIFPPLRKDYNIDYTFNFIPI